MITFKQFLREAKNNEVRELIELHCKPFLEESKRAGLLVRGVRGLQNAQSHDVMSINGTMMEYTIKQVRQDRKPLDTKLERHKVIDKWFLKNMGFRARSQAVFAYGEETSAQDIKIYGTPCVVFPIGPIDYVWSRYVDDLFVDIDTVVEDGDLEGSIEDFLAGAGYRKDSLDECVRTSREVMIKCSSYYAFPIEYKLELKESLGIR